jgi:hypothetical protein
MIDANTTLLPHRKCIPGLGVGHKEYDFLKTYEGLLAYQFENGSEWHWEWCGVTSVSVEYRPVGDAKGRYIYTSNYRPDLFWAEVYRHFKDTEFAPIIMAEILGGRGV